MSSVQSKNQINAFNGRDEQPSPGRKVLGVAGGTAAGFAMFKVSNIPMKAYGKSFFENLDKFTPQEQEQLIDEAHKMAEQSGLKEKGFNGIVLIEQPKINLIESIDFNGVKAEDVEPSKWKRLSVNEALQEIDKGVADKAKNGSFTDKFKIKFSRVAAELQKISQILIGNVRKDNLKDGIQLGCFESISNKVFGGRASSLLHEVGHAMNRNGTLLTKTPQNLMFISRGLLIPAAIITAVFTLKPKNSESNSDEKSFKTKVKEFTHKHIGLTIVGLSTPLLYEEASASLRAVNFAKKSTVLSDSVKRQHSKALKLAYGSYLLSIGALAGITQVVVAVKDKIQTSKSKKDD